VLDVFAADSKALYSAAWRRLNPEANEHHNAARRAKYAAGFRVPRTDPTQNGRYRGLTVWATAPDAGRGCLRGRHGVWRVPIVRSAELSGREQWSPPPLPTCCP
jgi:hypothetical protein